MLDIWSRGTTWADGDPRMERFFASTNTQSNDWGLDSFRSVRVAHPYTPGSEGGQGDAGWGVANHNLHD